MVIKEYAPSAMALTKDQMADIAKKIQEKTASPEEAAELLRAMHILLKEMRIILGNTK